MAGRVENLKPWPKGVSGNPRGRPKNNLAAEIAVAVFERDPQAVADAFFRALKKGNARVFKELADRGFGKVPVSVNMGVTHNLGERLEAARKRRMEREQLAPTAKLD